MPSGVEVLDWRHLAPGRQKRSRLVTRGPLRGQTELRAPELVDSVTVHQTAVIFGSRPSHRRKAARMGDPSLAVALRVAEDVPAHAVALPGRVVLRSPLRAYLEHAGRLNRPSLGLEVEGRFSGLLDDPATVADEAARTTWGDVSKLTPLTLEILEAAIEGLYQLVTLGRAEGMPIRYVYAHRQSSAARRSDPGAALWIGLRPSFPALGLVERPAFTIGDGRPLPAGWGPYGAPY